MIPNSNTTQPDRQDLPEIALLSACARTFLDAQSVEQINSLLEGKIEWSVFIELAQAHRVVPLAYRSLSSVAHPAIPTRVLSDLRQYFQNNAARNLFQISELLRLLKIFEAHQIPAVPYKGPVLASSIYGNLALRQFGDLDILIDKPHISRATELLLENGYQIELGRVPFDITSKDHYHYGFIRKDGQVGVELHWGFTRRYWAFPLDLSAVWQRIGTVQLGGTKISNFSNEDLLLILCAHGAQHFWSRLSWICDIAEILRTQQNINWKQLISDAQKVGCHRILLLALQLAHEVSGAELPKIVAKEIASEPVIPALALQLKQRLGTDPDDVIHGVEARVFYFKLRERFRDRMQYLFFHLVSYANSIFLPDAKERELIPLPDSLMLVYQLFWPIRRGVELASRSTVSVRQSE